MDRPTTKDVEYALEWFAQGSGPGGVLAAEVHALRAELHNDAANAAELRIVELRATVARVAALPAKWLDDVAYQRESVAQCAIDVENALRGEEP